MPRKHIIYLTTILLIVLLGVLGLIIWQKSNVKMAKPPVNVADSSDFSIRKVDMSKEPQWVQKLNVTTKTGVSANGLRNVTIIVTGFPNGLVDSLNYVLQYETTNKGTQGALSTKPSAVSGSTTWQKTIDFGTCSTKSCVSHEGVKSLDLELDLTTSSGDQYIWSNSLTL